MFSKVSSYLEQRFFIICESHWDSVRVPSIICTEENNCKGPIVGMHWSTWFTLRLQGVPLISETSDMQKVKHVLCWVRAKPGIILLSSLQNFLLLRERKEVIKLCCVLSQKRTSFGSKRNWLFCKRSVIFWLYAQQAPMHHPLQSQILCLH